MDQKEKYAIEVMFEAAGKLLGYKIDYSIAVDQFGSGMINSFDNTGVNGYSIIQKQFLNTVYDCYEKNISQEDCVNEICKKIDKIDFKEKTDDPFYHLRK